MAEDTGVVPPALLNKPELLPHLRCAWDLFHALSGHRATTGPSLPTPIQLSEFLAYAKLYQFSRLSAQAHWKTVRQIDRLWLRELVKRQEAEHKAAKAKAKRKG